MSKTLYFLGFLFGPLLGAALPSAQAKDLTGRLGLGFNRQFSNYRASGSRAPGLAFKYALTKDIAVEAIVGFSTASPNSRAVGGKIFKNIFYENYLNFYGFGAAANVAAQAHSGYDLQTGLGVEFFIPGVDSVGFSFEMGGELTDISGKSDFRTIGFSFLESGMRFYF